MKKQLTAIAAIFVTLLLSFGVHAAQQGELSPSASVGQFTNTLGVVAPALRQVQVLNVVDALVKRDTPPLQAEGSATRPGVRDNFCVVDTLNGAVKLTFTNTKNEAGWVAKDVEGKVMNYRMLVSPTVGGALNFVAINASVTIESVNTVTGAALCGAGNVSKGITANDVFVPNVTYVDTVVITATPV